MHSEQLSLRSFDRKDILQAAAIVTQNYDLEYSVSIQRDLTRMFTDTECPPYYIGAYVDARLVGFAGCGKSHIKSSIYTLFWVNVHPEFQRQGIGTSLINRILTFIRSNNDGTQVYLNTTVERFYLPFGFVTRNFCCRKNQVVMSLDL